jgi:hypothetical protein
MAREKSYEGPYAGSKETACDTRIDRSVDSAGNPVGKDRPRQMTEIIDEPSFDQPASKPIPRKW